jgi:3-dehydroquinate dehydratase I
VIASRADLERALRMRRPPDLFELRLDHLAGITDRVEKVLPKLHTPLIITARHPREGGASKLRLRQRRDLLAQFLNHAQHIDVELRSAPALRSLLTLAKKKNIRRIISFHSFKSTPSARILAAKARAARSYGADIFKVATRTDTPVELGCLLDFISKSCVNVPLAVMGIGKLGAISRVLLARAGSVLIYASVGTATDVEGQLSLEQLRALGFGP